MQKVVFRALAVTLIIWVAWQLKAPKYQTAICFIKCKHA